MQLLVEISLDADDRVTGAIAPVGAEPRPFSGWLELMRLLEDALHDPDQQQETT